MQNSEENTEIALPNDVDELKKIIRNLNVKIALLERYRFGSKSERYVDPKQGNLFNEVELAEDELGALDADQTDVVDDVVAKNEGEKKSRRPQIEVSAETPRKTIIHEIAEEDRLCACCSIPMAEIGEERVEKIKIVPAHAVVEDHVYKKYACQTKSCDGQPAQSPREETAIPKIKATEETLAFIAVQKYQYSLPLYRLEYFFKLLGITLSRYVMSLWMVKLSEVLRPIYLKLEEMLLSGDYLHMDETTLQVLKEPGRQATSKSYMWIRTNDRHTRAPPIVLYHYDQSRSGEVASALLGDFKGYLQTDDYAGYSSALKNKNAITHVLCWDHARRYFWNAYQAIAKDKRNNTTADQVLKLIGKLYKIEERGKSLSIDDRTKLRQSDSLAILNRIESLCNERLPTLSEDSKTAVAIRYMKSNWEQLLLYTNDGRINISNSPAEQRVRPFAVGRKNWLFANTQRGADASAIIYSIIETAKLNGLDPYKYICDALCGIAKCDAKLDDLLPVNNLVH